MSTLKRFTDFILQNRLQAMVLAFLLAFFPLLGGISVLMVGLVTLRRGALEGFLVTFAVTLAYVISYTWSARGDLAALALGSGVLSMGAIWAFALLLRRYHNWSMVVEYAMLAGTVVIGIIHLVYSDVVVWWVPVVTKILTFMTETMGGEKIRPEDMHKVAVMLAPYCTGVFFVLALYVYGILQLMISRWWQAVVFNPGGLRSELVSIRISHVMGVVFTAAYVWAWMGNETVQDIMTVLYIGFMIAGLSLMHFYVGRLKYATVILVILYLVIWRLTPYSVLTLVLVAWLDTWVDLRKRLVRVR